MRAPMPYRATLNNRLLVATPLLERPYFSEAVIFIFAHNDDGANGLMLNKPLPDLPLAQFLKQLNIPIKRSTDGSQCVRLGGPLSQKQGFILYQDAETTHITRSQKMLEAIAEGKGPEQAIITLGYCAWGAGQLEQEIVDNHWFLGPAEDPDLLFETPSEILWQLSASTMGINFNCLSREIGHA